MIVTGMFMERKMLKQQKISAFLSLSLVLIPKKVREVIQLIGEL